MRKSTILIICTWMMLGIACKEKELPQQMVGTPEFFMEGLMEESSLEIQAGNGNYYMETGYELGEDNVLTFKGAFKPFGCKNCKESLLIEIRDRKVSNSGDPFDMDFSIPAEIYDFQFTEGEAGHFYRVAFTNESSDNDGTPVVHKWSFGDGTKAEGIDPVHIYQSNILSSEVNVCLTSEDGLGCETQICNLINLEDDNCSIGFSYTRFQNGYIAFDGIAGGSPPFEYRWDFGDGFSATLGNPGYSFPESNGFQRVCLTIIDSTNCEKTLCKNIALIATQCEYNYSYSTERKSIPDSLRLGGVKITWFDENGEEFVSDSQDQPETSLFEVIASEEYEPNEIGEKTRKLTFNLDCKLYGNNQTLHLSNASGAIGVAHP